MQLDVHVARVGIFNVDSLGNRIDKSNPNTSINQLKATRQDALVIADSNYPNTAGYPTIKSYIEAESNAGYELLYMDSSFVITGIPSSLSLKEESDRSAVTTSAFGEPIAAQLTPVIQLDGIFGFNTYDFEQYTNASGSVSFNNVMTVSTGSSAYGRGVLRSRRAVRYRPGQGAVARFTAMFSNPLPGYTQRAGFLSQESAIMVGYNGTSFGILRQNGGKAHIHTLTITNHSNIGETVTITLNGVSFNVVMTGNTIASNSAQIAAGSYAGWIASQVGATIYFLSSDVGPKAGAFSVSASDIFTGTMAVAQVGVNSTDNWLPQSMWNVDKLDGNGPSGMLLNPQKLNVFQINFRWLGAGEIRFALEDQTTGNIIFFHHIHYVNTNTTVHIDNPSLKIGYVAADVNGAASGTVTTSGASMMGGIEGAINITRLPAATFGSRTTNMNTGSIYHVLSIKNRLISANKINSREIVLQKLAIGATAASSASCFIYIYVEPTYAVTPYFEAVTDFSSKSTTESTLTGTPVAIFTTTTGAPNTIDLHDLRLVLPPNTRIAIGISSTATLQRADAALTYTED